MDFFFFFFRGVLRHAPSGPFLYMSGHNTQLSIQSSPFISVRVCYALSFHAKMTVRSQVMNHEELFGIRDYPPRVGSIFCSPVNAMII